VAYKPYLAIVPSPASQWTNNTESAPDKTPPGLGCAMTTTHSEFLEGVPLPWAEFRTRGVINDGQPVQNNREKSSAVRSHNTAHAKRITRGRGESLDVRSNIVSIRGLQRGSCVEPDIWSTSDQRLKGENNRARLTNFYARTAEPKWIMMVRGGLRAYIFSKSPVLERIENDQGFISAVGKQGLISSVPNWPK